MSGSKRKTSGGGRAGGKGPGPAKGAKEPHTAAKSGRQAGARKMRLERIRQEIESGTYETEGKLRIAISRLIEEVLGDRKRSN